jgi:type IV pilus assembly protein PilY1
MRALRWKRVDRIFIFAILGLLLPVPVLATAASVDVYVNNGGSDAEEETLGTVNLNDATLDLGGTGRRVGLHFASVNIPRYAHITAAHIQFNTANSDSTAASFKIEAEASDNPVGFAASAFNLSSRSLYSESVSWAPAAWSYSNQFDTVQNSADIKALVQKIVSRPNWNANNAMAFIVTGTSSYYRRAKSFESHPSKAPKLHIEWNGCMVEVRVAASNDDMYQNLESSIVNTTNVNIASSSLNYCAGLRFQNVNIPEGAVITSAYIRMKAKAAASAGAPDKQINIWGEKRLDPPTFTADLTSIDTIGKRRSTSQTEWKVYWSSLPAWSLYQYDQTPDLKSIVQEIAAQPGWSWSTKAMVFFMNSSNETRSVYSWNGDPNNAPLLHIEFLSPETGETGMPVMSIPADYSQISSRILQGESALSRVILLQNNGSATLTYHIESEFPSDSAGTGWLTMRPLLDENSLRLAPGASQTFTLDFDSASLATGLYHARITFFATNFPMPSPASQSVEIYLTVEQPTPSLICAGDVPLYLRQTMDPAVLILLDLSESMAENASAIPSDYPYPQTPDLKDILSEIVNYPDWQAGNALTIFFELSSGSGLRHCWAFDGLSAWAPRLHVEYTNPNEERLSYDLPIYQAKDDGGTHSRSSWNTGWQTLEFGAPGAGYGVALRFRFIPIRHNATIHKAYIKMVASESEFLSLNLTIRGHQSANSPELTDLIPMNRPKTTTSVSWSVEPWTGLVAQSKMEIAKQVISSLVASEKSISWGFGTWADAAPYPEPIPAEAPTEADRTYTLIHEGCAPSSSEHLSRIQAAIAATTYKNSLTPFAPSFLGAKKYFSGQKADQNGIFFSGPACQPKVVINITDGLGNVPALAADAYRSLVETRVRDLLASEVSVVGLGFGSGSEGDWRGQLQRVAELANAEAKKSTSDLLYALHAEDAGGKGVPYFAEERQSLAEALMTITRGINEAMFYGSAPAAFSQTDLGNLVLVNSYRTGDWSGDLQAIAKDASGRWNNELWRASEKVPVKRQVRTVIDSGQVITYTGYNFFCKPFGDTINSAPVVVGPPPFYYNFDNYNAFVWERSVAKPRDPMVYFGANDGLIHAVRLMDGVEKWAFMPYSIHMKLTGAVNPALYDRCSPSYCHSYLLDASPKVADIYEAFGSLFKQWHTILVIGQGAAGDSYTFLDITGGEGFDAPAPDGVQYLGEFTDPDLGQTLSEPVIERVHAVNGACTATGNYWGVFFGSGYALNPAQQPNKEAFVYGLKADSKMGMWRDGAGSELNKVKLLASGYRPNNAASTPLVADLLNMRFDWANYPTACKRERLYVGDLYGTLYRMTGIGPGESPHQTRLFQFSPLPANPGETPVRAKPTYAYDDGEEYIWVYYGTGRYENDGDKTNAAQQYFFGLKDEKNPALGFNNVATTYTLANLTALQANLNTVSLNGVARVVRTITGSNAAAAPWYLKLHVPAAGGSERVITKPLAVGRIVFFTTFIPDANGCGGSGDTYLFALDFRTGLPPAYPVMDINGDGKINDADKVTVNGLAQVPAGVYIGRGRGSAPVLFKNTVFITTTVAQHGLSGQTEANQGGLHAVEVNLPSFRVRQESWKHNG